MINTPSHSSPWLAYLQPDPRARLRLFCFPHAGGAASMYLSWPGLLPASISICPIQYPGRENRLGERPLKQLTDLADGLAPVLRPYVEKPFAFFGHSMGALAAFELAHLLNRLYGVLPAFFFVSGFRAPQLPPINEPIANLPEDEFIAELRSYNGTPDEILESREMMQLLMPTLRADFNAVETYRYTPKAPLRCPIAAFGGTQDHGVPEEDVAAWGEQTTSAF